MSGALAATIIAGVGAATAIGGTVMSARAAGAQQNNQDKQLKLQKTAQSEASAATLSNQRKSEVAQNQANQKVPDIAAILSRAASASKSGLGSTMLTGSGGVDAGALNLGKTSLLGS